LKRIPDIPAVPDDVRRLTLVSIRQYLSALHPCATRLKVAPDPEDCRHPEPAQHMHLMPEVFIQLTGFTDFTCGRERFRLNPGEICFMPRRTPHAETAGSPDGLPFRNIVITYGWPHLLFHVADALPGCHPRVAASSSAVCLSIRQQIDYIEEIIRLSRHTSPVGTEALTGLQMAYFASVWTTLAGHDTDRSESDKTARIRRLVASRLGNPELSVEYLAGLINCHPDYLSHLFRTENGSTLTQYINEQRTHQARNILDSTPLSIKEVAAATGYRDAGYFIRIFRRQTGTTPAAYRRRGNPPAS